MKKQLFFLLVLVVNSYTLVGQKTVRSVLSPSKNIHVSIGLNKEGTPYYKVSYFGATAVDWSKLGFNTKTLNLQSGFSFTKSSQKVHDGSWKPVWGEVASIRDHYTELLYNIKDRSGHSVVIHFKVYDDGVGFRYEFSKSDGLDELVITDELTEFQMVGDHTAWWIPGDYDSNEHVYSTTKISAIDATWYNKEYAISTQHIVDPKLVQTPITMKMDNGHHIVIAEAGLTDFAALHLRVDNATHKFSASLIPSADPAVKSTNQLPFNTPWRAILLSKDAAGILESKLILNLNEPCKLEGDLSWIKPQKYVGVWWEMHVGLSTWDYEATQDMMSATGRKSAGKHGANTENVKRYIDFASKYGFDGVLVEGWNVGWKDWFGKWKDEVFDFAKPYPDYDIDVLSAYAKEKGVRIIAHHETSAAVPSYERQMQTAYDYMHKYGMNSVKTGYVGKIIPKGEWHDGQWMVKHYVRVAAATGKNKIMLDAHEPVRPSGLHRTYPNWMACEAARGQEFNAWSTGNPPEHECILPFTRILGGPMDYTPGIFETRMSTYDPAKKEVVHTTVAKQLALYVTLYSPLQMAADLPENYEKRLDVFQFIRDVPVDWDNTKIVNAAVGDYITTARRQKGTDNWFLGSITDEKARNFTVRLDFLKSGKTYEATIYEDGKDAHWESNPYPVDIRKVKVRKGDRLDLKLAAGGGCAISMKTIK